MADKRLRLHVIDVTTRAALSSHPEDAATIRDRSHELLARLETVTINDGADPALLRDIEAARRRLWE
jgi:hypothetical protein